jgi:hypothetical protein
VTPYQQEKRFNRKSAVALNHLNDYSGSLSGGGDLASTRVPPDSYALLRRYHIAGGLTPVKILPANGLLFYPMPSSVLFTVKTVTMNEICLKFNIG